MARWWLVAWSALVAGCGATGGDECETDDDCGDMKCVTNWSGDLGSCSVNEQQPLICQTPCTTDADCADAEYGNKEAPRCMAVACTEDKYCMWSF